MHVLGTPPAFTLSQDQTLHHENLSLVGPRFRGLQGILSASVRPLVEKEPLSTTRSFSFLPLSRTEEKYPHTFLTFWHVLDRSHGIFLSPAARALRVSAILPPRGDHLSESALRHPPPQWPMSRPTTPTTSRRQRVHTIPLATGDQHRGSLLHSALVQVRALGAHIQRAQKTREHVSGSLPPP